MGNEIVEEFLEKVLAKYREYKEKDLLVIDRSSSVSFVDAYADSLYAYKRGFFLLDRFYKRDKCNVIESERPFFSDDDVKLMNEFIEFTKNMPDSSSISEEEANEYTNKIKDYEIKIQSIKADSIKKVSIWHYNNIPLMELSSASEPVIDFMAKTNVNLFLSMITACSWFQELDTMPIGILGIEHEDYIDVVACLVPTQTQTEEPTEEQTEEQTEEPIEEPTEEIINNMEDDKNEKDEKNGSNDNADVNTELHES